MKNSGFRAKSEISAFNKNKCQAESEVLFNPLLLIHANRCSQAKKRANAQTAHLVFPTHIANTKPKEPFFPTHYNIIQKRLLTLTIIGQVQIQAMTLGQKIRELRQQAGLKQREVAYQLGIGEGYLSKVENEHKPLKREDLIKLGKLFKVPIEDLESLWLASKVYSIVRDEENALSALKVAEEQIKYNNLNNA